jgi:hypothetical protein
MFNGMNVFNIDEFKIGQNFCALKENWQFVIDFTTSFQLQMTFITKIPLVVLDKLHLTTLVTNDVELWMKEKSIFIL